MDTATSLEKKRYWVVVADEAKAIVYTQETKSGPLERLLALDNDSERKKTASLIADRGGRSFDSHGEHRHTLAREKADPHRHIAMQFAKNIAERVTGAIQSGECREFSLVAAPRFLGMLRDALAVAGNADPVLTIDKEVVSQEAIVIEKLLAAERQRAHA